MHIRIEANVVQSEVLALTEEKPIYAVDLAKGRLSRAQWRCLSCNDQM